MTKKHIEQLFHLGHDGWEHIVFYLNRHHVESVLLVTGKRMYASSGAEGHLTAVLKGKRVRRVFDFDTNPKADDIRRILKRVSADKPYDVIIALGGGSVLDFAKLLKAFWNSSNPVLANLSGDEPLEPSDVKLIAVPSTAGSGSEATPFAVVYRGKEKFSIIHEALRPDLAIVIPSLLESLPQHVAASSGMDALCQAIESYWSIYSTDESRVFAREAMTLAWSALEPAVLEKEASSLENLARASYLAGKAISITKTTAPHAVSYVLTSFYGVSHGHAVGLLVAEFLNYNWEVKDDDCLDPRGVRWVIATLVESSDQFPSGLANRLKALPPKFQPWG